MANEPTNQPPGEEFKKDTVRINLPTGVSGKPTAAPAGPTPTVKLRPTPPVNAPAQESKVETVEIGQPGAPKQAKRDTARVEVPAAKPSPPEVPRPTVKLKREDAPSSPAPSAPASATAAAPAPVMAAEPSGLDTGLAIAAAVLSIAVIGFLYTIAQ